MDFPPYSSLPSTPPIFHVESVAVHPHGEQEQRTFDAARVPLVSDLPFRVEPLDVHAYGEQEKKTFDAARMAAQTLVSDLPIHAPVVSAHEVINLSDERLKNVHGRLMERLGRKGLFDVVQGIEPIAFDWKDGGAAVPSGAQLGFSAQVRVCL